MNYEPIKITAHLFSGFAATDPFTPSIDSLLAYWHMRKKLGAEKFAECQYSGDLQTVNDLPLEKMRNQDDWWYLCSLPIYDRRAEHLAYYHRRFDAVPAAKYTDKKGKVETRCAPYKATRQNIQLIVCGSVSWHVVGDKCAIEQLLENCHAIGAKKGSGYGRVKKWELSAGDPVLAARFRPVPESFAQQNTIHGTHIHWGYRPPVRLAENKTLCVIPNEQ